MVSWSLDQLRSFGNSSLGNVLEPKRWLPSSGWGCCFQIRLVNLFGGWWRYISEEPLEKSWSFLLQASTLNPKLDCAIHHVPFSAWVSLYHHTKKGLLLNDGELNYHPLVFVDDFYTWGTFEPQTQHNNDGVEYIAKASKSASWINHWFPFIRPYETFISEGGTLAR